MQTLPTKHYYNCSAESKGKLPDTTAREAKIAERRAQIPKAYQSIYDKAMEGKSRKAAMHAFCLECSGWLIKEVFACSDSGCSLYPYRPKSRVSQEAPESASAKPESKNSTKV